MEDGRQGAVQTSWRIVVDEDSLNVVNGCGRMWDSGKNDSRNQLVAYAGKKLQPFTRYYWKVICSDMEYKETASPVSYFETGMMGMQHWQGAWIGDGKDIHYGPAPYSLTCVARGGGKALEMIDMHGGDLFSEE